jgi:rhamnulokinase
MEEVFRTIPRCRMYELTGIQFLPINTVFQLYAMVQDHSPQLEHARDLLFIPDLFNYFLTGRRTSDSTFATTSQLLNPHSQSWEVEIFRKLGLPASLMQEIVGPGTVLGELTGELEEHTGLGPVPVVAVATHDTASAVAAVPTWGEDFAYISSGTWSLVGIELPEPIINEGARECNFTNEGGVGNRVRFLKNGMGLWLLQECRKAWARGRQYSYEQLVREAEEAPAFQSLIDPDCLDFLCPADMPGAIADFCSRTGQPVPESPGQFVRCVLESLALAYRRTLEQLRTITGRRIERVHVIGGGAQNELLCRFTAQAAGVPVYAGPSEATAVGNLLMQAMALGRISSLEELRRIVRDSFELALYEPQESSEWQGAFEEFRGLCEEAN